MHTGSDLKVFLTWCAGHDLNPPDLGRVEIERYVRWLQEVRRYQPSTVSRRLSVVVGFYRVCVIGQILAHSPADYLRRPPMPAEYAEESFTAAIQALHRFHGFTLNSGGSALPLPHPNGRDL